MRISLRNRNHMKKYFSIWITDPDGLELCKKRWSKISWHCSCKTRDHAIGTKYAVLTIFDRKGLIYTQTLCPLSTPSLSWRPWAGTWRYSSWRDVRYPIAGSGISIGTMHRSLHSGCSPHVIVHDWIAAKGIQMIWHPFHWIWPRRTSSCSRRWRPSKGAGRRLWGQWLKSTFPPTSGINETKSVFVLRATMSKKKYKEEDETGHFLVKYEGETVFVS